ncbi:hypothetical protein BST61_g4093 [Cercospora zeina]
MTKIPGLVAIACILHALATVILATPSNGNAAVAAETCSSNQCSHHETALEAVPRAFRGLDPHSFNLEQTDHLPAVVKREPPHPPVYPPPIIAQAAIKLVQRVKLSGRVLKALDGPHDECPKSEDLSELLGSCTASPSTISQRWPQTDFFVFFSLSQVNVAYALAMTLSSYFREKQCALRCTFTFFPSHFRRLHHALWDIAATTYTITQAVKIYQPNTAPMQLVQCRWPGNASCYNIFYSNVQQPEKSRTLHRLDFVPGTQKTVKVGEVVASDESRGSAPTGMEVYGTYVFSDGDPNVQIAMGFNVDFPKKVATAVSEDATLDNKPAISCLNLSDDDSQKAGTFGWLAVSPGKPVGDSAEESNAWMEECGRG